MTPSAHTSQEAVSAAVKGVPVRLVRPTQGWRALDLRELWQYRDLFWMLLLRDVTVRYRQTILGVLWAIARPVAIMLTFTLVFGRLVKVPTGGTPYSLFVFSGLVPWVFFSNAVAASTASLLSSSPLLTKVYFPRLIIPLASVGASFVDLLISTALLGGLVWFYGVPLTPAMATLPLLLVAVFIVAASIGIVLAALTASYRDVGHLVPFLLQLWLYVTPVIYPAHLVPERWRWVVHLNPMAGVVGAFRSAATGEPMDPAALVVSAGVSLIVLVGGVFYFARVERRFADII